VCDSLTPGLSPCLVCLFVCPACRSYQWVVPLGEAWHGFTFGFRTAASTDCLVSDWVDVVGAKCSAECDVAGTIAQTRTITRQPTGVGVTCPSLTGSGACIGACYPKCDVGFALCPGEEICKIDTGQRMNERTNDESTLRGTSRALATHPRVSLLSSHVCFLSSGFFSFLLSCPSRPRPLPLHLSCPSTRHRPGWPSGRL
jgi:hypothetical protein